MKEKLTTKELALYLGCKVIYTSDDNATPITGTLNASILMMHELGYLSSIFPILRPLSDITEQEKTFVAVALSLDTWDLNEMDISEQGVNEADELKQSFDTNRLNQKQFAYLLSRGFDLFNWAGQMLAIIYPASVIATKSPERSEDL